MTTAGVPTAITAGLRCITGLGGGDGRPLRGGCVRPRRGRLAARSFFCARGFFPVLSFTFFSGNFSAVEYRDGDCALLRITHNNNRRRAFVERDRRGVCAHSHASPRLLHRRPSRSSRPIGRPDGRNDLDIRGVAATAATRVSNFFFQFPVRPDLPVTIVPLRQNLRGIMTLS